MDDMQRTESFGDNPEAEGTRGRPSGNNLPSSSSPSAPSPIHLPPGRIAEIFSGSYGGSFNTGSNQDGAPNTPRLGQADTNTTTAASKRKERRFLMLCVNTGKHMVKLEQLEITTTSHDQSLFHQIRNAYDKLRGCRTGRFSLFMPVSVDVIKVCFQNTGTEPMANAKAVRAGAYED